MSWPPPQRWRRRFDLCRPARSSPALHQLPDDPPPPNEPPPPEKPPPSENPPEEPEDQSEPDPEDQPLDQPSRDLPRPRFRGMAPTSVRNTNPKTTTTSTMIRSESQ